MYPIGAVLGDITADHTQYLFLLNFLTCGHCLPDATKNIFTVRVTTFLIAEEGNTDEFNHDFLVKKNVKARENCPLIAALPSCAYLGNVTNVSAFLLRHL